MKGWWGKVKVIKVWSCEQCPYIKKDFGYHVWCEITGEKICDEIKEIEDIPKWCPLDDYEVKDDNANG